jgi:predicted DNA-binding transcriptional regulator AlpA
MDNVICEEEAELAAAIRVVTTPTPVSKQIKSRAAASKKTKRKKKKRGPRTLPANSQSRWLRKPHVGLRYGISERSVDRKVEQGKLPKPHFPIGENLPLWDRAELEKHDAHA